MQRPNSRHSSLPSLTLVALASFVIPPMTSADEFPETEREMRDFLESSLATPDRPTVFCVFTQDGRSDLDRNQGLDCSTHLQAYRNPMSKPRAPGFVEPDVYFLRPANGSYRVWVKRFSSARQAIEAILKTLNGQMPLVAALSSSPIAAPVYPEPPRHFLGMDWNGESIGEFSFGKRFGGWTGHALYAVTFCVGNLCITVEGYPQGNVEKPLNPDPRQIAAELDRYYSTAPTERLSDSEKHERNTLQIEIESQGRLVAGATHAITFLPKQDAEDLNEVRFRVTQGEVFEVDEDVGAKPRKGTVQLKDRRFFVRFTKGGRQSVACYHINAEGECIAWGQLDVDVVEE